MPDGKHSRRLWLVSLGRRCCLLNMSIICWEVWPRSKYQTMRCVIQCVIFSMEISMEAYFEGCFAFGSPLFDFNNNCFADSEVIMPKASWLKANTVNTNKQGLCNFGACDPGKCHFCDKEEDNICYGIGWVCHTKKILFCDLHFPKRSGFKAKWNEGCVFSQTLALDSLFTRSFWATPIYPFFSFKIVWLHNGRRRGAN